MLVVLCVASFSVTAFAYDGGVVDTTTDAETTTDTESSVTDETEAPATDETETDFEIPFNYTIDNDGNLIITIEGATDPAEITTTGTVVTNGARLNLRTGAGLDFELILKVAGVGLIVTVVCQIMSKAGRDEQSTLVSLVGMVVILILLADKLGELVKTLRQVFGL